MGHKGMVCCSVCGTVNIPVGDVEIVTIDWGQTVPGLHGQVVPVCPHCGSGNCLHKMVYRVDTETVGYRSI